MNSYPDQTHAFQLIQLVALSIGAALPPEIRAQVGETLLVQAGIHSDQDRDVANAARELAEQLIRSGSDEIHADVTTLG